MSFVVFKSGTHISANGVEMGFSDADLREIAESYNPALHEAPLVIGHPKTDDPAWGWVSSVKFKEGANGAPSELTVETKDVEPQFAELVNKRRYAKRSIALYPREAKTNPTPGKLHLKHIGFLGAVPPAIKGLPAMAFSEDDGALCFSQEEMQMNLNVLTALREWIVSKFGVADADAAIPKESIAALQAEMVAEAAEDAAEAVAEGASTEAATAEAAMPYSEGQGGQPAAQAAAASAQPSADPAGEQTDPAAGAAEFSQAADALAAREEALAAREKALAEKETAARATEMAAFAETVVKSGKVHPSNQGKVLAVLRALSENTTEVEFAEGQPGKPAADLFRELLEAQTPIVEFGEVAAPTEEPEVPQVSFTEAPGYHADPVQLALLAKAQAHQAANPGTSILDAVKAVRSQT